MNDLSIVESAIWFAGISCQLVLLAVLLAKRRWQSYFWFTVFICAQTLFSVVLLSVTHFCNPALYGRTYLLSEAVSFLLAVGVIAEMFGILWRRIELPKPISRPVIVWTGLFSFILAFLCSFSVGADSMPPLELCAVRGAVFTSFLLCGCFICASIYANSRRIRRPKHAMIVGWGMTGVALLELSADFRFFTQGWHLGSNSFDRIQDGLYVVIVVFWIVGMWRSEMPGWARSPELMVRPSSGG